MYLVCHLPERFTNENSYEFHDDILLSLNLLIRILECQHERPRPLRDASVNAVYIPLIFFFYTSSH